MKTYKQIKSDFKEIGLGVVKLNGWYQVYFLSGIQKDVPLANVRTLNSLEELLKANQ